jgi:GDSL-like Lipase/Acylhydrolase family
LKPRPEKLGSLDKQDLSSGATGRATAGQGLIAVGDSITEGLGRPMLTLQMRSWTAWLADALGFHHICLARSGHRAADALREQIPLLGGTHDLGCVYIGVNDVRAPNWQAQAFERDLTRICGAMVEHARELVVATMPADLGRPKVSTSVISAANDAIAHVAACHGAHLLDLRELRGWTLVLPDGVHLTARGEAYVALLACRQLAAIGMTVDERELVETVRAPAPIDLLSYACGPHAHAVARHLHTRTRARLALALRSSANP